MGWIKSTEGKGGGGGSRYSSSSFESASSKSSKRLITGGAPAMPPIAKSSSTSSAAALVKKKKPGGDPNFGSMLKKFIAMPKNNKESNLLLIPSNSINNAPKKKESNFPTGLHQKLFSNSVGKKKESERKAAALTMTMTMSEVNKSNNTRTLAMVLRSERELLALNKDQHHHIAQLNTMLQHKYTEVDKLKDLCLKQREEIRSLKNALLFPETMDLEKQSGSELKQLIPTLQRQVSSLTGQLHCLALDLAQVKADKYFAKNCSEACVDSPKTPTYDQHDAINSLEFSSEDQTTPGSPDDMFTKDFNPCLTPYSKTKSNEFLGLVYESPKIKSFSRNKLQLGHDIGFDPYLRKVSKSSDCCQCSNSGSSFARTGCRSDETKSTFGNQ